MTGLSLRKCEQCGGPVSLHEGCERCAEAEREAEKRTLFGRGKAKSSRSGPYSGRWRTRSNLGEKLGLRHRVERAQRVGLIMVVLALAIIVVKHYEADVTLDAKVLFMQVPLLFELRDSGSVEGVLSYLTIALSIDAMVLLILYLYSFLRPVPGLMLIVVASIVDSALLFDPIIFADPKTIVIILAIKIVAMLVLLSGYKAARLTGSM